MAENEEDFVKAVSKTKLNFQVDTLKQEQVEALHSFICKKDVFVNLPTGFGKSLIFQMVPLVVKEMGICTNPIVIVVSPLVTLMREQVKYLNERGVSAISLSDGGSNDPKLKAGDYMFVYSSPESLLSNDHVREMLSSPVYKQRVFGVVVDEAHCISHWGYGCSGQADRKAFREWFAHIQEIRSLVPNKTPVMALTATAVKKTKDVLLKNLGMKKPVVIAASPNRENISYAVKVMDKNRPLVHYFMWLIDGLKEHKANAERVIIYCQTIKQCHKLYSTFSSELGDFMYPNVDDKKKRFLEMLHSITPDKVKDNITQSMTDPDGCVRVLICTIAFGMGINCKNVSTIIHIGPSKNVESYVQESGRCGREGGEGRAIIYFLGRMLTHVNQDMKVYVNITGMTCRRKYLLKHFDLSKDEINCAQSYTHKHDCCDVCVQECTCGTKECKLKYAFTTLEPSPSPARTRTVNTEQRDLLNDKLLILRKELHIPLFEQFVGYTGEVLTPSLPTFFRQFSSFQIAQINKSAHCLFSLSDITRLVEIWEKDHAVKVHRILDEIFQDMEPLVNSDIPQTVEEPDDFEEDEWEELMNDSLDYMSVSNIMDMSSFDHDIIDNMDVDDIPHAVEEALEFV